MIDLAKEEMPTKETYDYVLFVPEKTGDADAAKEDEEGKVVKPLGPSKGYQIYCIDISGSMDQSTEMSRVTCKHFLERKSYPLIILIVHVT